MKGGGGHFETTTWRSLQVLERGTKSPSLCHSGSMEGCPWSRTVPWVSSLQTITWG